MKKFFFGSSGSSKTNSKSSSQLSNDNQVPQNQRSTTTPTLKKSRTYSSGTIHESGIGQRKFSFFDNRSGSPSRSEASQNLSENRSTRCGIASFHFVICMLYLKTEIDTSIFP